MKIKKKYYQPQIIMVDMAAAPLLNNGSMKIVSPDSGGQQIDNPANVLSRPGDNQFEPLDLTPLGL